MFHLEPKSWAEEGERLPMARTAVFGGWWRIWTMSLAMEPVPRMAQFMVRGVEESVVVVMVDFKVSWKLLKLWYARRK